jgi:hypothetical protein
MATGALTEEIAANLEEVAEATRQIDPRIVGSFLGGNVVGAALGFFFGFRWNREKIKAEAFKESEEEVQKIREMYEAKTVAAQPKPSAEEIVEEKGYRVAYTERPLRPPVPVQEERVVIETPEVIIQSADVWNYPEEIASRSPDEPYVIHQNEYTENETGYVQKVFTYWLLDEVLTDEENTVITEIDGVVGLKNLQWGHGTDDPDVVFIRNEFLELEAQVCRIEKSYEQEVVGIGPEPESEIEHSAYPKRKQTKKR